ncbi:hypothetical protein IU469_22170 [Nocardia puris]|uniref:hypothetical protein n=1 Tax=Nocardia puris TaxID=208602 RepID=UPI001895F62E|nr:hypothetical protein [Nocardia puris]MBF6368406.1 hypothetical protein [Nocardia puris]
MDTHMFIDRHDRKLLRDLLASLPRLLEDLETTVTKQARIDIQVRGGRSKKPSVHPWPYYVDAAEARAALHASLVGWVRLTLEHRGMEFDPTDIRQQWHALGVLPGEFVGPHHPDRARPALPSGPPSTTTLARWLWRHLIALAMTPGAEGAYEELAGHRKALAWFVCPPPSRIVVNEARRQEARALQLNARGIAALAAELGEEYRNLTQRRVRYLADHGHVRALPSLMPWRVFLVGAVLDAHLAVPIRERHAVEEEAVSA